MIPKIMHSRSKLVLKWVDFPDGNRTVCIPSDTYPDLFDIFCPEARAKSPRQWKFAKTAQTKFLWFPAGSLGVCEFEQIEDWKMHFEQYVLIGCNKNIEQYFSDELDFCMALDYNFDPATGERTLFGEAEYQLKYRKNLAPFGTLKSALTEALDWLPIPDNQRRKLILTAVPAAAGGNNRPLELIQAIASSQNLRIVTALLRCPKPPIKSIPVNQKVQAWRKLYSSDGCVHLDGTLNDAIVVIIDDLYQSGATMWCYAQYLKKCGARCVLGLTCVKSMKDTDNQ